MYLWNVSALLDLRTELGEATQELHWRRASGKRGYFPSIEKQTVKLSPLFLVIIYLYIYSFTLFFAEVQLLLLTIIQLACTLLQGRGKFHPLKKRSFTLLCVLEISQAGKIYCNGSFCSLPVFHKMKDRYFALKNVISSTDEDVFCNHLTTHWQAYTYVFFKCTWL